MNLDYTKIQDNVNKYRYGVKIGNYNEETFGMDMTQVYFMIEYKIRMLIKYPIVLQMYNNINQQQFQSNLRRIKIKYQIQILDQLNNGKEIINDIESKLTQKIENSSNNTMKATYGLQNTLLNMPRQQETEAEKEYYEQTTFSHGGLQNHLLVGHGQQSYFETRQLTSTYDLSHNQQVKPQVQIHSKYEPNKTQFQSQQKKVDVTDKVQHLVPDLQQANQERLVKKKEFTNTFNDNYKKIPLRK